MGTLLDQIVRRKLLLLLLCIAWLACLSVLSLLPYEPSDLFADPAGSFRWDYLEHFGGYFMLGALLTLWRMNDRKVPFIELLLILASGVAYSFLLECAQLFIPGRTFNMIDVAFNGMGLAAGVIFGYPFLRKLFIGTRGGT